MNFEKFLWIMVGILLMLSMHTSHAQGPIYNFNFFNNSEQSKVSPQTTNESSVLVPDTEKSDLAPSNSLNQQINELSSESKKNLNDNNFVFFGYGNDTVYESNNKTSLNRKNFEFGFGLGVSELASIIISGNTKSIDYEYSDQIDLEHLNEKYNFEGKSYGFGIGPAFIFKLNSKLNFITKLMLKYSKGKIDYPHYYRDYSNNISHRVATADFTETGAEFGLGFDLKLFSKTQIGIYGQYGSFGTSLKAGDDGIGQSAAIPSDIEGILKNSSARLGAGLNIKFLI